MGVPAANPAGVYVHLPFCASKCPYCDFASSCDWSHMDRVLAGIRLEARRQADLAPAYDSLYLGGGTPSVLPPDALAALIADLSGIVRLPPEAEITVELNPADVVPALLDALAAVGVRRLSLGVQSFCDDELRQLGRRHDRAGAVRAIEAIGRAGFAALGLDLIHALPDSDPSRWQSNLRRALAFSPEHLSCYTLTVAEHTPFGEQHARGALSLPDEDTQAIMFLQAHEELGLAGYEHYEVSNYARGAQHRSRHNQKYWTRTPYLGLGPAAHSFDGACRWSNHHEPAAYCEALDSGLRPVSAFEELTEEQVQLERIGLGLRTADGVALAVFSDLPKTQSILDRLVEDGLLTIVDDRARPTAKGLLVADGMARMLV